MTGSTRDGWLYGWQYRAPYRWSWIPNTDYIETSVVSDLTARPTRDLPAAAWRKVTLDPWQTQRRRFDLSTSEVTIHEAGRGDPEARTRQLAALANVPLLPITDSVAPLATALVRGAGCTPRELMGEFADDLRRKQRTASHSIVDLHALRETREQGVTPNGSPSSATQSIRKHAKGRPRAVSVT